MYPFMAKIIIALYNVGPEASTDLSDFSMVTDIIHTEIRSKLSRLTVFESCDSTAFGGFSFCLVRGIYIKVMRLLHSSKGIRDNDEVEDIDDAIAIDVGLLFAEGVGNDDEIKNVNNIIPIDISEVGKFGCSLEIDFAI